MSPPPKSRWQQATALVSLGAGGVVTGLSFVPGSPADVTSPTTLPFALMALEKSAQPTHSADAVLRAAIVNVARHFLQMAEQKSPAEMEAIIWQQASLDGADHGPSCAAFASLTLELASHVAGQQSWVTGGTSYPWPLHAWADARVDPNPASPQVVSVLQDAEAHHRWHPLGDGYEPQPGDWVLFDGHVEVVTNFAGGVLQTIGGDSLPNYSVNAHSYPGPLSGQGVAGFVDNGLQPGPAAAPPGQASAPAADPGQAAQAQGTPSAPAARAKPAARPAPVAPKPPAAAPSTSQGVLAPLAIPVLPAAQRRYLPPSLALAESGAQAGRAAPAPPGPPASPDAAPRARAQATPTVAPQRQHAQHHPRARNTAAPAGQTPNLVQGRKSGKADIPATGMRPVTAPKARPGQAEIPGLLKRVHHPGASPAALAPYQRHQQVSSAAAAMPGSAAQRAFIEQVAPGAMASQRKYGVPASVTIAQAIDESGWGQSLLATQDHNLFGIKGTGPAGSDFLPTQEFSGGQLIDTTAPFRIYHDIAQSIDAHGKLLARSDYYAQAMANKGRPDAFAASLTGVYATDPTYGTNLIDLMRRYNLYRFDTAAHGASTPATASGTAAIPGTTGRANPAHDNPAGPVAAPQPPPAQHSSRPARPGRVSRPSHSPGPAPNPVPAITPVPVPTTAPAPSPQPPGTAGTSAPADPAAGPPRRRSVTPANLAPPTPAPERAGAPGTLAAGPSASIRARTALVRAAAGAGQAPGTAAAVGSTPAPLSGHTTDPAAPASAGPGPGSPHALRSASTQGRGQVRGTASSSRHAGPAAGPSDAGTGQPRGHEGRRGAGAGHALAPGEADIPGLPYTAASPAAPPAHRARIGSPLRPAHPPASARSTTPGRPVGAARAASGYPSSPPAATAQPTNRHPGGPWAAQTGQAHSRPSRPAGSAGAAMIPGLPGGALPQAPAEPSTAAAAGWGDAAFPGLQPAPPALAGHAGHGMEAAPTGGASIPGLPWQGSETGGHRAHEPSVARRGHPATGAAHGTNLAPTYARRLGSDGQRRAAPDHGPARSNRASAAPVSTSAPVSQPGSTASAAPGHTPRSHPRAPGSVPSPARPARLAAPRSAPQAAPASPPRSASLATATAAPPGYAAIPGMPDGGPGPGGAATGAASPVPASSAGGTGGAGAGAGADMPGFAQGAPAPAPAPAPTAAAGTTWGTGEPATVQASSAGVMAARYSHRLPPAVGKAYLTSAKVPLLRGEPLYLDMAGQSGIPWEILAACDWMQCRAKPGLSPVYGEKLGTVNPDGTSYRTRSAALERCAYDLVELARSVYHIDLTRSDPFSVRELANVFAAFRWGGLLKEHHTSAMEFPYSVAGLTTQHMHMRWPNINDPEAPDKPGTRFHGPFGAVPLVLSLSYPATA